MAVMKTCCCCGVRQGSVGSAIYSLVLAIIGLAYFGWSAAVFTSFKVTFGAGGPGYAIFDAFYAIYIIACVVFVFMIIACILVFIGISQDSKGMLIPFMVAQGLHLLWYILIFAVDAAFLAQISDVWAAGYTFIGMIILLVPFFIGDLVCLLCVISQYQEYNDGRGRANDQPGGQTNTTVVIHTTTQAQPQAPPAYKQ